MSEQRGIHLTEDEFSAAILDEPLTAATRAHFAVCPVCQAEVNEFRLASNDFRRMAGAWSEQRSSEMMSVRPRRSSAQESRMGLASACAWGVGGLVAIGITLSVDGHLHQKQVPATVTAQMADEDSPEQIARDNQLLAQVHFELTRVNLPEMQVPASGRKAGPRP